MSKIKKIKEIKIKLKINTIKVEMKNKIYNLFQSDDKTITNSNLEIEKINGI